MKAIIRILINIVLAIVALICFGILVGENGPEMSVWTLIVWKLVAAVVIWGDVKLAQRLNPKFFDEISK